MLCFSAPPKPSSTRSAQSDGGAADRDEGGAGGCEGAAARGGRRRRLLPHPGSRPCRYGIGGGYMPVPLRCTMHMRGVARQPTVCAARRAFAKAADVQHSFRKQQTPRSPMFFARSHAAAGENEKHWSRKLSATHGTTDGRGVNPQSRSQVGGGILRKQRTQPRCPCHFTVPFCTI